MNEDMSSKNFWYLVRTGITLRQTAFSIQSFPDSIMQFFLCFLSLEYEII